MSMNIYALEIWYVNWQKHTTPETTLYLKKTISIAQRKSLLRYIRDNRYAEADPDLAITTLGIRWFHKEGLSDKMVEKKEKITNRIFLCRRKALTALF